MKRRKIAKLFFAILLLLVFGAHAFVLEDLIQNSQLQSMLQNKKVGYYVGSFDPIHKGHEEVVQIILSENLCDYVIVYPSWGGDSYKQRANIKLRLGMLFDLFKDHPRIIVTRYSPQKLQTTLLAPKFEGIEFVGVIGSDVALWLASEKASSRAFMSGVTITPEHENHTWGGAIALPVNSFIVSMRAGDDLSALQGTLGGRKIAKTITLKKYGAISSALIKNLIKNEKFVDDWISDPVTKIIKKNELYTPKHTSNLGLQ
ncbi:MAG: hypothetical protein ACRCYZ_03765 [Alphaproteobacteria bacterium]